MENRRGQAKEELFHVQLGHVILRFCYVRRKCLDSASSTVSQLDRIVGKVPRLKIPTTLNVEPSSLAGRPAARRSEAWTVIGSSAVGMALRRFDCLASALLQDHHTVGDPRIARSR